MLDIVLFRVVQFCIRLYVFQDERYIRQYREETEKMRNQIKELKTRFASMASNAGKIVHPVLIVIYGRSCLVNSHFVLCFLHVFYCKSS